MKTKQLPTQERLHELLNYDPETGVFTHRICRRGVTKGSTAGYLRTGYLSISIDGIDYKGHRLAWMYEYGEDPGDLQVDHKDRDRSNNRISNLRLATTAQNKRNNTAKGFSWKKDANKWYAKINVNGVQKSLGLFSCYWEAYAAYWDARYKYFGEFA